MERKVTKALLVLLLFLMAAVLGIEGGRDLPGKDDIYSPQHLLGWGGPFGLAWPFPLIFPLPFPLSLSPGLEDATICFPGLGHPKLKKQLKVMPAMPLLTPHDHNGIQTLVFVDINKCQVGALAAC